MIIQTQVSKKIGPIPAKPYNPNFWTTSNISKLELLETKIELCIRN